MVIASNAPGATYAMYMASEKWKVIATQAKKRAGFKCQLCNDTGQLNVHHRTYDRLGDERDEDLVCLCRSCHARFHDKIPGPPNIRINWLLRVKLERPLFYNLVLCQSQQIWMIPESEYSIVVFGSDADDLILKTSVDRQEICGRIVFAAKSMSPEGLLAVSYHGS